MKPVTIMTIYLSQNAKLIERLSPEFNVNMIN
jgi:hypothetical protein